MKKILYMILGCVGVGLGAVGAIVPMLPAFPFLMLAAFSFARSSEKLHNWFVGTKLYQDNLADFVAVHPQLKGFEFYPLYVMDMSKLYFE